MSDNLATIEELLRGLKTIRGCTRSAKESLHEWVAALTSIKEGDKARKEYHILVKKLQNMRQAIDLLQESVKSHCAGEETFLRPVLGNSVMEAITREQAEAQDQLDRVKLLLARGDSDSPDIEQLFTTARDVEPAIQSACHMLEANSSKEESLLQLLRIVLQSGRQRAVSAYPWIRP